MPTTEQRQEVAERGTMDSDRLFAENVRRLLLKVVSMIEDRYGLRPINQERRGERASVASR